MIKLKKHVRKAVAFLFRASGIGILIRQFICRNKVTILVYHNPEPVVFESHIRYLSKHCHFLPLKILIEAIRERDWSSIPPKSVVIVFDDGLKGNRRLLKAFERYRLNPTIYICSHIVNTNRKYWFNSGFKNHHSLKKHDNSYRLDRLKEMVDYEPEKEYDERQALSLEEIREMERLVDFQSHSKFHPILTNCSDEECREEIEGSKSYLEEMLDKPIEHFCYPNGDYSDREVEFVKKAGYKSSRSIDIGWNDMNSDPFRLKAMYVDDDASIDVLNAQIAGFFGYLRYMRMGSFNGKHPPYA